VLASLEKAYDLLESTLGLRPPRKLDVVVYDPAAFDRQFAGLFRFPAAGFYGGSIRVRGGERLTVPLSRVLHHELVHAALDAASPSLTYPGWLNEGLAEWFEARSHGKRHLDGVEIAILARAAEQGRLFSFDSLAAPSFGHLAPGAAHLAYLQSYGLMEYLARRHGERSLRDFCVELVRTGDLRRSLRRIYRADLDSLAVAFVSDLG